MSARSPQPATSTSGHSEWVAPQPPHATRWMSTGPERVSRVHQPANVSRVSAQAGHFDGRATVTLPRQDKNRCTDIVTTNGISISMLQVEDTPKPGPPPPSHADPSPSVVTRTMTAHAPYDDTDHGPPHHLAQLGPKRATETRD